MKLLKYLTLALVLPTLASAAVVTSTARPRTANGTPKPVEFQISIDKDVVSPVITARPYNADGQPVDPKFVVNLDADGNVVNPFGGTPALTALGALTPANNLLPYFTSATTAATTTLTTFGRALIDDADPTAGRASLGLGTIATLAAPTGTVVGTTDTQTLTSKTLTTPSIDTITLTGGQIAFPAAQNPSAGVNTLDDYEEGTFTPALSASVAGPTGVTYSSQVGTYTKVGRQVSVNIVLTASNLGTGGSGQVRITGLPFTSAGVSAAAVSGYDNTTGLTSQFITALVPSASAFIELRKQSFNTTNPAIWTDLTSTFSITLSATYFTT